MKIATLLLGLLGASFALPALADDHQHPAPAAATNAGFEKLKTLVGTWVVADEEGHPTDQVVSVIRLTAGGSALHETLFPGQDQEMISVYTVDGSDIVMTHYCVLGNQPQMKARAKTPSDTLNFEFVGGTNLDPQKDMHMHAAVLKFVDNDHFEVEGIGWQNGKPTEEMCGGMKLVRKK
ncbi:MAG: hypothetical protein KF708_03090 [Pirellulales bacterium]|nr:hypothetical protein [Pirellulales bacterium]